jgi:hypothetical protein
VTLHKNIMPPEWLHGGVPYDLVTGPLAGRFSQSAGRWVPNTSRPLPQTSIHTQTAADLFNTYMDRHQ